VTRVKNLAAVVLPLALLATPAGPLRRRRVRHRHGDWRGQEHSGRPGTARAHRVAATRPLLPRTHGQHALTSIARKVGHCGPRAWQPAMASAV